MVDNYEHIVVFDSEHKINSLFQSHITVQDFLLDLIKKPDKKTLFE